jgi:hypothetical protein
LAATTRRYWLRLSPPRLRGTDEGRPHHVAGQDRALAIEGRGG